MSYPVWIAIGPLRFHPHMVFELLAFAVGIVVYQSMREKQGDHLTVAQRWSLFAALAVGAVIGSRILNWLDAPTFSFTRTSDFVALIGGQTVVGGLLGAWIAVEIQKRRIGIVTSTGDLLAVPAAAGMAVGRIGCFLTGLSDGTHGLATTMPWGIDLGDGIARHPTALYESLFLAVLALVLWRVQRRLAHGVTFVAFVVAYLSFRLCVDMLKPGVPLAFGLTAIQWACVAGLAYYAVRYLRTSLLMPRRAS